MTNDTPPPLLTQQPALAAAAVRASTRQALAQVGLRLARSVAARLGEGGPPGAGLPAASDALWPALAFAEQFAATQPACERADAHPLSRLGRVPRPAGTDQLLEDLLLFACLPEAHEGFACLCRMLHPEGLPLPTVVLGLQWLETEQATPATAAALRDRIEELLCHSPVADMGLLQLQGSGPWHSRTLVPGPGMWAALMARPPQLPDAELLGGYAKVPGLEDWLQSTPVKPAVLALSRGLPCQILLTGGEAGMRATRARALLGAARVPALCSRIDNRTAATQLTGAYTTALMHQACWWLAAHDDEEEQASQPRLPALDWRLPVLTSARSERQLPSFGLPLIRVPVQTLTPVARRALWQSLLPQLAEHAGLLAARYPIDPDGAREVVRDLALRHTLADAPLPLDQVGECIRARTSWRGRAGMQRVLPRADWSTLLLPGAAQQQLQSAVRRIMQQITVLDDWGFAQGRAERRGVRMLFFGAPGTGKTLAAEVMARELGVDLLVVDLAALVSKWLGETEKNLAAVFDVAERSRALLLFDEADALFAKRTETQDAHDRYANLETAYLLQRLERYEGVAVLTTNLRANLDKAFARRFEYIVEFPEPDAATRETLWRMHLPPNAPLASDVDLAELAAWYPLSGAQIKNAALAAAFLAAAATRQIQQHQFLLAIEREYDKSGRAHPGFPPQVRWPQSSAAAEAASHAQR